MRSRASLRLRQLKADRGPAAITHDEPHERATGKRQLIFAVGQSVPHPAAGVRHQEECILDSSRAQLHLRKAQTAVVARCGLQRQLQPASGRHIAKVALRRLMGYAAPRAVAGDPQVDTGFPDSDVIVLVPELMGEATRRGDRLDREAIFGAA